MSSTRWAPILDPQQPARDERVDERLRDARLLERGFQREVVAKTGLRQQLVLDEAAHAVGQIGDAAFVKIVENLAAVARHEIRSDLRVPEGMAAVVELVADDGEQGRLHRELGESLGRTAAGTGHEFDDRACDTFGDEPRAGFEHGLEGLRACHAREPHPVFHQRRHDLGQSFELRQEILAERKAHAVIGPGEIERLQIVRGFFQPRDDVIGDAVFYKFGEGVHERDGPVPLRADAGPEGEEFLELVDDKDRHDGAAIFIHEPIIAVMEKFPERLTRLGDAGLRPRAGARGGVADEGLDLFGGRRCAVAVIEADVARAIAGGAQLWEDARLQERGFAEARLAEEHRERLALDEAKERANLLVAPVEEGALGLGKRRQTGPGVGAVDGGRGNWGGLRHRIFFDHGLHG
ncbi:MAG: hypothetical protein EXS32_16075 [Opitutus sp.]|nr:hypothetical protein [Opitutus sp.]